MSTRRVFDALLVLQYKSGDKDAFGMLVKRHHHKLCRHSYTYTQDVDSSKDIVQDCWNLILKKIDSLKNPNAFGSWAMRIVTRKSLDFVNLKAKEMERAKDLPRQADDDTTVEHESSIEKLRKAISVLPQDQQTVLNLFYTQEYSLREISEILEVSVGTVKSRLFHAREKLKAILKS